MANFKLYWPKLVQWEGSAYENVPGDNGGPTKYGVILSEWIAQGYDKNKDGKVNVEDLKLISESDASGIAKTHYWDKLSADKINNQSIAEFLVDYAYNCGVGTAAKALQSALGVTIDGIVGLKTIAALNTASQGSVFSALKKNRLNYYLSIVERHPDQMKFLKGWQNRTNSFTFKP